MTHPATTQRMATTKNFAAFVVVLFLTSAVLPAQDTQPSDPLVPQSPHPATKDTAAEAAREIARLEKELAIVSKKTDPLRWARIQQELGLWWFERLSDDRLQDMQKSIDACRLALTVLTPQNARDSWIGTQLQLTWSLDKLRLLIRDKGRQERKLPIDHHDLGIVQLNAPLISDNKDVARQTALIQEAVDVAQALLTQITREGDPLEWRKTQEGLGIRWNALAAFKDKSENLTRSIAALNAALTAPDPEHRGEELARNMGRIGSAWMEMPFDNDTQHTRNLRNAIENLSIGISLLPRDADPSLLFGLRTCLAECWRDLPSADNSQKQKNLTIAAAIFREQVLSDPNWENGSETYLVAIELLAIWEDMPADSKIQREANLHMRAQFATQAMKIITRTKSPALWGVLCFFLADSCLKLGNFPGPQQAARLRAAAACLKTIQTIKEIQANTKFTKEIALSLEKCKEAYEQVRGKDDPSFDDIRPGR